MKITAIESAVRIGIFSAAAVIGGLIKIPSPVGSIALDSFPGYFAAAFYNPLVGGIVGLLGHLGSAATAGFPIGALHLAVALEMFVFCSVFGLISRASGSMWGLVFASVVAIALNGVLLPFPLVPLGLDQTMARTLVPFLVVASAMNIVPAAAIAWFMARKRMVL